MQAPGGRRLARQQGRGPEPTERDRWRRLHGGATRGATVLYFPSVRNLESVKIKGIRNHLLLLLRLGVAGEEN